MDRGRNIWRNASDHFLLLLNLILVAIIGVMVGYSLGWSKGEKATMETCTSSLTYLRNQVGNLGSKVDALDLRLQELGH